MSLKEDALAAALVKLIKERVAEVEKSGRANLLDQLAAAYEAMGVKSVDVSLPDGTKVAAVSLWQSKERVVVHQDAFVDWVAKQHPSEIVHTVRDSFRQALMKRIKIVDGQVVNTRSGEVMPWASVRAAADKPTSFAISFAEGGREAIEQAWRDGRINPLDHLAPQPLLEGGDAT